jgi:hypothetical protein
VNLPAGPPLAVLPDSEAAWPTTGGKEAGFKMGGYRLDEKRRPAFFYEFKGVKVEESFEPVMGEIDAYFKRTVRFSGDVPDNLWFRAAVGQIEEKNGKFVLNGKVTMSFPGAQARIRAAGSQRELIVPVRTAGGVTEIVEEVIW